MAVPIDVDNQPVMAAVPADELFPDSSTTVAYLRDGRLGRSWLSAPGRASEKEEPQEEEHSWLP